MKKPTIAVLSGEELFDSFFDEARRKRLSSLARWTLQTHPKLNPAAIASLAGADAFITT
jgi:hypothetical protein